MQIYELKKYPKIYKLAVENTWEYLLQIPSHDATSKIDNLSLNMAFGWSGTKEGTSFWADINRGDYARARVSRPDLFEPDIVKTEAGTMEVKNNGLWERR